MSNGLTFKIRYIILQFELKMAFAKFQGNRLRTDGEIAENMRFWLSIFNVTLGMIIHLCRPTYTQ